MFDARPAKPALGLLACLACVWSAPARAQSVEDFYRGKTITITMFSTPGSAYDIYARLLAQHMPKHIPGRPQMLVKSLPGAGGLLAARNIAEVAPRDGTVIGALSKTLIYEPLLGKNAAKVDYLKFGWLGSMSQSTPLYVSWKTSKVKTAFDLFEHELLIPATGAGSETTIVTNAINGLLGTKFKLIEGYSGSIQALQALESGEVDGGFPTLESLKTLHPDWMRENKINVLFQARRVPDPEVGHVPPVTALARSDIQRKTLEFLFPEDVIGRPFLTPPGVPADRLAALQRAFAAAVTDPELVADARKINVPVQLTDGESLARVVRDAYATAPDIVERVRAVIPSQ